MHRGRGLNKVGARGGPGQSALRKVGWRNKKMRNQKTTTQQQGLQRIDYELIAAHRSLFWPNERARRPMRLTRAGREAFRRAMEDGFLYGPGSDTEAVRALWQLRCKAGGLPLISIEQAERMDEEAGPVPWPGYRRVCVVSPVPISRWGVAKLAQIFKECGADPEPEQFDVGYAVGSSLVNWACVPVRNARLCALKIARFLVD